MLGHGNTTEALWEEQAALESQGWVDHQVYGPTINADGSPLSDGFVTDQLQAPMVAFRQHFQKAPIAVIWPSGLDRRSAQAARALGYRLGFTINPRGPLMFNWVPLANSADKFRPSYFPEGPVEDPLMTLPRYWPGQVLPNLDAVRVMGDEAASLAQQNKATEMAYRYRVCGPTAPPNRLEARRKNAETTPLVDRSTFVRHVEFCRIVGQAPRLVHRDEQLVAFRDIRPAALTHLIVPSRHIASLNDDADGRVAQVSYDSCRTDVAVRRAWTATLSDRGEHRREAGQSVSHCICSSCGKRMQPGQAARGVSLVVFQPDWKLAP
jgi:hypothetical protein